MFVIGRAISLLSRSASVIGALCVVLMVLHVTADVIGRYVFNAPLPGTIVIVANYYMILLVFLSIGIAEEKRSHISVEFFTDMMPERAQVGISAFGMLLTLPVVAVLMIGGYDEAMKKTNTGTTMEQGSAMIEVWQSYWAVPIGAGLMGLVTLYRLLTLIFGTRSGLDETAENRQFANE
jgi:TRAP-type C4-dicarboxylate transport system permease small subunit